jgi:CBS domain-containing protein
MTVKAILSGKGHAVETIAPSATLADAAKTLSARGIGAVVVTDPSGEIIGLLSERDIVRATAERGAAALQQTVDQVMTRRVITCTEADTVGALMEQMTNRKFRHLPVVEDGKLVGIISIGDVVKYRLGEMEAETNAMREYIATA